MQKTKQELEVLGWEKVQEKDSGIFFYEKESQGYKFIYTPSYIGEGFDRLDCKKNNKTSYVYLSMDDIGNTNFKIPEAIEFIMNELIVKHKGHSE